MKRLLLAMGVGAVLLRCGGEDAATAIHVPVGGDVAAAVAQIRERRAQGLVEPNAVCTIQLAAGTYPLAETLELGAGDSHLRFVGVAGRTVLTGGVALPPFSDSGDGVWRVTVPRGMNFDRLWVNGVCAQRAKTPNAGFLYMKGPCLPETEDPEAGQANTPLSYRAFYARTEDVAGFVGRSEAELTNVVIRAWHSWNVTTARLKSVRDDGLVLGSPIARVYPYFFWKGWSARYELENYREALDAPGEWFLDVASGVLSYIPRPGESAATTIAVAPRLSHLVTITGSRAGGATKIPTDIAFDGLTFAHAAYGLPPEANVGSQGASGLGAAIEVGGCEGVTFARCVIRDVGLSGLWFRKGARHCGVFHSRIENTGASAVRIGEAKWEKAELPDRLTAFVTVDDCILRCGGCVNAGAPGVLIQHASDCAVTHCEVADFLYTGISCGWTWGYRASPSLRNLIGWNHIHHIGRGQLSDLGGIYHLGDATGTRIVGNVIHDVQSYDKTGHGGHGIYMDEGTSHLVVESNLVYRVKGRCLNQNYGKDNLARNNVFAKAGEAITNRSDDDPFVVFTVSNCAAYVDAAASTAIVSGAHKRDGFATNVVFGSNVYACDSAATDVSFFGGSWKMWTANGQDGGSRFVPDLFVNARNDDYRFRDDAVARAAGIVPWSYADAGVSRAGGWRAMAERGACRSFPPVDPPLYTRDTFATGFEDERMRLRAFGRFKDGTFGYGIELCTNAPHAGRHCVRFTDNPRARFSFWPHMQIDLAVSRGRAELAMWLKTDEKTRLEIAERDYHAEIPNVEYVSGPTVMVVGDGIHTGGKTLKVPVNAWWRLGIVTDFTTSPVTYDVTVTTGDGQCQTLHALPAQRVFRHLEWVGFLSNAHTDSVFYLDDFSLSPR